MKKKKNNILCCFTALYWDSQRDRSRVGLAKQWPGVNGATCRCVTRWSLSPVRVQQYVKEMKMDRRDVNISGSLAHAGKGEGKKVLFEQRQTTRRAPLTFPVAAHFAGTYHTYVIWPRFKEVQVWNTMARFWGYWLARILDVRILAVRILARIAVRILASILTGILVF